MCEKIKSCLLLVLTATVLFGFSAAGLRLPDAAQSAAERRKLTQFPEWTAKSVESGRFMRSFEDYALDQFPLRDTFRSLKACTALYLLRQQDVNDLFVQDGCIFELDYPLHADSVRYAGTRFRYIYDRFLSGHDVSVYLSVIPDKNRFLSVNAAYPLPDYDAFARLLQETDDFATYIDITPTLSLHDYYRTDSHWRQEEITDTAQLMARRMGAALSAGYTKKKADQLFSGVYLAQSALPLSPEPLYYLDAPFLEDCIVYDYETDTQLPVYNMEKAQGNDPYELFLSGPKALLTIENPHADMEKELVIFRDSFASALAPLLAEGYAKITLADIRYISPALLGQYLSFDKQDVLFLYSTSVLNHSETLK